MNDKMGPSISHPHTAQRQTTHNVTAAYSPSFLTELIPRQLVAFILVNPCRTEIFLLLIKSYGRSSPSHGWPIRRPCHNEDPVIMARISQSESVDSLDCFVLCPPPYWPQISAQYSRAGDLSIWTKYLHARQQHAQFVAGRLIQVNHDPRLAPICRLSFAFEPHRTKVNYALQKSTFSGYMLTIYMTPPCLRLAPICRPPISRLR